LVKLEHFERFVFILTVLESYPDRECASLMNCSKHDVVEARVRALRQFGKVRPASAASLIQQPATTGASFSDS
jgi:DNA-directed RNA polymerase specialized sigma24 family protein